MDTNELEALIKRVRRGLRVTKVVATRSVKTKKGDFFAGFSAAWNTVQDDAGGPGADLDITVTDAEVAQSGMTLRESRVAHLLVAMQADLGAYEAAFVNGAISDNERKDAEKAIKSNYGKLIREVLLTNGNGAPVPDEKS